MIKEKIYKCPHCGKCIALAHKRDDCILVDFHKTEPLERRPHVVQMFVERRCAHAECKRDFIVECYAPIHDLLRWLIFHDPDEMARCIFENNTDLIRKLRQDKKFMELINNEQYDN